MSGAPASTTSSPHQALRNGVALLLTVALGGAGGFLFLTLKTPLPWMMGAMCFSMVAALAGVPLRPPKRMRTAVIAIIGLMVGSAFTPEVIARAVDWLPSVGAILAYSAVMIVGLGWLLRRTGGYDPVTAFSSAAPGGFAAMILLGGSLGGDMRTISLMHSVRVVMTVVTIPFWFRFVHDYVPSGTAALGTVSDLTAVDAAVLAVSALVGYGLARLVRTPLPSLIGPMVAAALVHTLGISAAHPPGELVALAQVVIGVSVGCRFLGCALKEIAAVLRTAAGVTFIMLVAAIGLAGVIHLLTGLPFEALVLAFAPGGVAEMNVVTVALHIDPAFVATHHLTRLAFLLLAAPAALRLLGSKWADEPRPGPAE